jgi:hypothetical protein
MKKRRLKKLENGLLGESESYPMREKDQVKKLHKELKKVKDKTRERLKTWNLGKLTLQVQWGVWLLVTTSF